jgi:hypothetical protein
LTSNTDKESTGVLEEARDETYEKVIRQISISPIERGGEAGPAGYAKAILNAKKMVCKSDWMESDAEKYIGKHLLSEILTRSFDFYNCPRCNTIL